MIQPAHSLSRGKRALSSTITLAPACRSRHAALEPAGPPPPVVGNEDETQMMVEEFDTEERERAREHELERRRRGAPADPSTDDPDEMSDPLL